MYEKWVVSSFIRVILRKKGESNLCFSCDRAERICLYVDSISRSREYRKCRAMDELIGQAILILWAMSNWKKS